MRQFATLLFLLLVICSTPCAAKTIYVNNMAGSDFNTGSLPDNQGGKIGPLRTIKVALRFASRGDKIVLAKTNSPYQECVTLQGAHHSGLQFAPFVIDGNGATLDGTAVVPAEEWQFIHGDVYRFTPDRGGFQMLFLDGKPAEQMPCVASTHDFSFLQPQQWCRCRGGIYFRTQKGKTPDSYDLGYAKHRVGITMYDVQHVIIQKLTVQGFQLDGINAHDNAMDCVLYDVTAAANGRSGIAINGASRVKVVECKAQQNAEVQVRCDNWSTTDLIRTELQSETRPTWTRHVNARGQGARLAVDGIRQSDLQGWWTKQDALQQQRKNSLNPLEDRQGKDRDKTVRSLDSEAEQATDESDDGERGVRVQTVDDSTLGDAEAAVERSKGEAEPDLFEEPGDEDPFGEGSADDAIDDMEASEDDPFAEEF